MKIVKENINGKMKKMIMNMRMKKNKRKYRNKNKWKNN